MKAKRDVSTLGIMVGVIAIIFAIVVFAQDDINRISTATRFGADFYTESYQATAIAVLNLYHLYELMRMCFGFILLIFGLWDILYFARKCMPENETNRIAPPNVQSSLDPLGASQDGQPAQPDMQDSAGGTAENGQSVKMDASSSVAAPIVDTEFGGIRCPNCGRLQSDKRRTCSGCGIAFSDPIRGQN